MDGGFGGVLIGTSFDEVLEVLFDGLADASSAAFLAAAYKQYRFSAKSNFPTTIPNKKATGIIVRALDLALLAFNYGLGTSLSFN